MIKKIGMKKIIKIFAAATILVIATACNSSNNIIATDTVNNAVDSSWIFTATDVMPQYGASRHADGSYSVNFSNNKLVVYLPYFGRAYSGADVFSRTGPLDFTSNKFVINKRQTKKGHWSITIKPKDYSEVQSMNFMFYDNGSANLSVTMSNRTPISFTGSVSGFK
jgi:hypothetical protein